MKRISFLIIIIMNLSNSFASPEKEAAVLMPVKLFGQYEVKQYFTIDETLKVYLSKEFDLIDSEKIAESIRGIKRENEDYCNIDCINKLKTSLDVRYSFDVTYFFNDNKVLISVVYVGEGEWRIKEEICENCGINEIMRTTFNLVGESATNLIKSSKFEYLDRDVIFFDSFNRGEIGDNWNIRTCKNNVNLEINSGKIFARENSCRVTLKKEIKGDILFEVDISKIGKKNHGCWDFMFHFNSRKSTVILFDKKGTDRVGFGNDPCKEVSEMKTKKMRNTGTVSVLVSGNAHEITYTDNDDEKISTRMVEWVSPNKQIEINIAAHPNSPRTIDNVFVFRD